MLFGGIHGLSLSSIFDIKYNVNFSFHYNDRFLHGNNIFSLNQYDIELLGRDKSLSLVIMDLSFICMRI